MSRTTRCPLNFGSIKDSRQHYTADVFSEAYTLWTSWIFHIWWYNNICYIKPRNNASDQYTCTLYPIPSDLHWDSTRPLALWNPTFHGHYFSLQSEPDIQIAETKEGPSRLNSYIKIYIHFILYFNMKNDILQYTFKLQKHFDRNPVHAVLVLVFTGLYLEQGIQL